jgi:hypothetical protein
VRDLARRKILGITLTPTSMDVRKAAVHRRFEDHQLSNVNGV